jgi:hypothetical protein
MVGAVVLPISELWSFWSFQLDLIEVVVLLPVEAMELVLFALYFVFLLQNISFETSKGSDRFVIFSAIFSSRSELIRRKYCDTSPLLLLAVSL